MSGEYVKTCTSCPYCGVGCGVIAHVSEDGDVSVYGDETHPANFGRLCSKGSALAQTLGAHGRLQHPKVNGERASWDYALDAMAAKFSEVIKEHGPDAVAFYVSGQFLTEDYYIANKLMKGYIGSGNIDTNSRLCMASSVVGHKRAFGADTVPGNYEDLETADLIVLAGSNLAWCHPVLYQRIVKAKEARPNLKIINIDPRKTASSDQAIMHLALKPDTDVALFDGLFHYLDKGGHADETFISQHTNGITDVRAKTQPMDIETVSTITGLSPEELLKFYDEFAANEKVVTVYSQGVNQARDGTDRVNAIINCHLLTGRIGGAGQGPFSVTGQPNAMGGREVGGLANQLASHMNINNQEHRDLVQRFWQSPVMAPRAGLTAVDMFNAVHNGTIKAIWIMATNPVVSMPNADHVRAALDKCELVIVSDIYEGTDTGNCADILLPSTGWGEKDGMVTNSERRISRQRAFLPAPSEAKHDWWQLCQLGKRMGFDGFDFEQPSEIFKEYAQLCAFENEDTGTLRDLDLSGLSDLSQTEYDELTPIQWPVNAAAPKGRARMFDDGQFFTPDRKARFITAQNTNPQTPSQTYPFILNTGRIRDQWHSMTRTGRAARLSSHLAEPFVEIHPKDAASLDLRSAQIAYIRSKQGTALARILITDRQQQGSVFMPMHFTDALSSAGRVDALTAPVVDMFSDQPALKSTLVSIERFQADWYGFLVLTDEAVFARLKLLSAYWAKAVTHNGLRYELAGEGPSAALIDMLTSHFTQSGDYQILDMSGHIGAIHRLAIFDEAGALIAALYLSDIAVALSRDWICTELEQVQTSRQRYRILAGRPGADMADKGAIICSCLSVGMNEIKTAIAKGCADMNAICKITKAGTNCGSCQPEIRALLEMERADATA